MATGEELARAIQTLAKGTQVTYDRTVEMIVSKIEDIDSGKYRVSTEGNSNIPAICIESLKGKLAIGDRVLVKVPNGDFSSISDTTTNLIECKLKSSSEGQDLLEEIRNQYYDSGAKTSDIYLHSTGEYALIAADSEENRLYKWDDTVQNYVEVSRDSRVFFTAGENVKADKIFSMYAKQYKYIRFSAKFKTGFKNTHTKGVYGIRAIFKDENGELKEYLLDFDAFVGTPYDYSFFNTQEAIFDLSADSIRGLVSLEFFEKEFDADSDPNIIPNIFVKDVNIAFVDKPDITPDSYYLYIQTPNGTIFDEGRVEEITLQGKLIYNASILLDPNDSSTLDKCRCYWYEEDPSITVESADYDKLAGYGWKIINLDENVSEITIAIDQVPTQRKYKLIVIYNDSITSMAEVTIARYSSLYDLSLEAINQEDELRLTIFNNGEESDLTGYWYVELPGGSYSQIGEDRQHYISLHEYMKYGYATFYCKIYDQNDNELGIFSYFFDPTNFSGEDDNNIFVSFVGTDVYHYDANGQITIDESGRERWLRVDINTGDGSVIPPNAIQWYYEDETTPIGLETIKTSDSSTMFQSFRIDSNHNILYYTIKRTYRENAVKNTIRLEVTFGEKIYTFNKVITFLKDGDQGTNGTGYAFRITPFLIKNGSYDKDAIGTSAIKIQNNQQDPIYLYPKVYHENTQLNSGYTCEWSCSPNLSYSSAGILGISNSIFVEINGSLPNLTTLTQDSPNLEYWVKAIITIAASGDKLTAYYPIDVITTNLDMEKLDTSTLLDYVKYTAAGFNPEYLNNELDLSYDGTSLPLYSWNTLETNKINILTTKLLATSSPDEEGVIHRIIPTKEYNYYQVNKDDPSQVITGSHTGLILLKLLNNTYLLHNVFMYLDAYGNEAINGWDGTSIDIDENGQYIFAPMIGAGKKNNENKFTGVVMGTHKGGHSDIDNKVGLYGYQDGEVSFALTEEGKAFFGKANSGGRINLDGNSGIIYGGNVNVNGDYVTPDKTGMYIRLADKSPSDFSSTKAIGIGQNKHWDKEQKQWVWDPGEAFYVTYDGLMYANGATVSGDVHANSFYLGDYQVLFIRDDVTNLKIDAANIMGSIVADTVYAEAGDVVDLTVDKLKTSRRVAAYMKSKAGYTIELNDNYIYIHEEQIEFISGTCLAPAEEQAKNPSNQLLFWEADPWGEGTYIDATTGYPHRSDHTQIFTTTKSTEWPVKVYQYTEKRKSQFRFIEFENEENIDYEPQLIMGAGYGSEYPPQAGQGFIYKAADGFNVYYKNALAEIRGMIMQDDYTDLYGLRKTKKLDFSTWGDYSSTDHKGTFKERVENSYGKPELWTTYTVEFDSSNRPIKIWDEDDDPNDPLVIQWE